MVMRPSWLSWWPSLVPLALSVAMAEGAFGCQDAVHDSEVAALGPETPGTPPGPAHRPGQPCLICHGGEGPGKQQFSVAGTIFQNADGMAAANGATVTMEDAKGSKFQATTNMAGNFFVTSQQWTPTYPITVPALVDSNGKQDPGAIMKPFDNRDGSCAGCHKIAAGPASVGPVYLYSTAQ